METQTETVKEMAKAVQAGLAVFWDASRLQTVVTAVVQQDLPLTVKELQVTPAALTSHHAVRRKC